MDEAQIRTLFATLIGEFSTTLKTELLGEVDRKNQGLAASITKEVKKLAPEKAPEATDPGASAASGEKLTEGEGKLTLKALQQQIESLKKERDAEAALAQTARKSSALTEAIAKAGTLNQGALRKLLNLEYGEVLSEENGSWFVKQGESVKPLTDAIAGYLATDEGKSFMPPSGTAGAGSTESRSGTAATTTAGLKASEALMLAF
jgi:hypothetical protein